MSSEPVSKIKPRLLEIDHQGSIVNAKNYNTSPRQAMLRDHRQRLQGAVNSERSPPPPDLAGDSLPQHSGYDLEGFIRSLQQIPLILISDQNSLDEKLLGLSSGADDYLANPYHLKELLV